jgi:cytochrome P450
MDTEVSVDQRLIADTQFPLPKHVPPELVFDISKYQAATTNEDPFVGAKDVQEVLPPVFYTASRGATLYDGTWVVTHYEDIREVYQNAELYSTENVANFQALVGETFKMIPLAIDPPEHGKTASCSIPGFRPRPLRRWSRRFAPPSTN